MTHVLEEPTQQRLCTLTRLQLTRPPEHTVFRVAVSDHGPMNPQLRPAAYDRTGWGRWDTEFGRTIYLAETPAVAYAEVLAQLSPGLPSTPIGELFPADGPADQPVTLLDAVMSEMPGMQPSVSRGWRDKRMVYEYTLPAEGWFVDVLHAESVAAINDRFGPADPVAPAGRHAAAARYTISDLTGEDRNLTTDIAGRIRTVVLDDGTLPIGIRYQSKHGTNMTSYAVWLRAIDDGKPVDSEPTKVIGSRQVAHDDPDLIVVADRYGMKVY